jgi:hypothetical protein
MLLATKSILPSSLLSTRDTPVLSAVLNKLFDQYPHCNITRSNSTSACKPAGNSNIFFGKTVVMGNVLEVVLSRLCYASWYCNFGYWNQDCFRVATQGQVNSFRM